MLSWLRSYYDGSDCCIGVNSLSLTIRFLPTPDPDSRESVLGVVRPVSPAGCFRTKCDPGRCQLSHLISLNLPSIPSPTTALPFPNISIDALLHPMLVVVSSPRADRYKGSGAGRRIDKGSTLARGLPDRLGRIEFAHATDWNFSSGCSPPFLSETQLPLSDTGR